ncbi:MAG: GIY-YIG catalytic domain protein [Candidatus Roizmanbacteria bacterium GW2011_GWA2_37_7]|uniref:GIY-YIG catalytic domain protein n=1 Tax=Candidatus Roizmanbacteria bacterium GW2011_GWA2_37_7 TaxID=1618481 RepID=A0A0G0KAK9_9BACT|nr:MAG: GIY-YIG catalytic domain protein [Candidatus Roizmanbacteria bacterium GW2011_GWA2_37_7]
MFCVYALYNKDNNKIYIGATDNLERRIIEHNQKRGNHFTAKYSGEWKLIYSEITSTRKESLKREKQLKSYRGRQHIKKFIPR